MSTAYSRAATPSLPIGTWGWLWFATYLVARVWVPRLPSGSRLAFVLAFLPTVPFAVWFFALVGYVRAMDEMQRRIHLEALLFAFPIAVVGLMTLGLLELTVDPFPRQLTCRVVWHFLPLLYGVGILLARRRYR